jgi:hypothetical protein
MNLAVMVIKAESPSVSSSIKKVTLSTSVLPALVITSRENAHAPANLEHIKAANELLLKIKKK